MIYQQDWLVRQVQMMIEFLINIALKKKAEKQISEFDIVSQRQTQQIKELLSQNRVCEAENLIFETANTLKDDADFFITALEFYDTLNNMDEETLNKFNFSHKEIKEGLKDFCSHYDIADDVFMKFDLDDKNCD